jgi:hypothetical protein
MEFDLPDVTAIEERTQTLATSAADFQIVTDRDAQVAGSLVQASKAMQAEVRATFDPLAAQANQLHKAITAARTKHLAPLEDVERVIKGKIGEWSAEQERARREAEEAQRREAMRLEAEKRKNEMAAIAREAAAKAKEATSKREAERIQREAEEAKRIIKDAPVVLQVLDVPEPETKIQGVTLRKNYDFRVVTEALVPDKYWVLDEKMIGREVRALGPKTDIPGVQVFEVTQVASRK